MNRFLRKLILSLIFSCGKFITNNLYAKHFIDFLRIVKYLNKRIIYSKSTTEKRRKMVIKD